MNNLVLWDNAKRAVAECKTIDEVKTIRDKAEAMRKYAKQIGESAEVQNDIAEIKLRAERRMGEFLKEMPKNKGSAGAGNPNWLGGNNMLPPSKQPTLQDVGVSKMQSSRYQAIASLDETTFENIITETKAAEKELTENLMLKTHKKIEREAKMQQQKAEIEAGITQPNTDYDIIVIDPPWSYVGGIEAYDSEGFRGGTDYPTMSIQQIMDIDLPAKEDCVLWLWTTNSHIYYCADILESWGFTPKTILTWDKQKIGIGRWLRSKTEHCILAVKGKPYFNNTTYSTLISAPRSRHSEKPQEFYDMVSKICAGKKLDYFARKKREGWDVYGDEL